MTLFSLLEKGGVYLLPNLKKETMELEVKTLRSPNVSTVLFCLIIKHLHYLKAIEGGTEFCWVGIQALGTEPVSGEGGVGDWETGVRVEKQKLSFHNTLLIYEFCKTMCI